MKETPILFNGEMVRAILSGQKTQTRRIAKTDHSARVVAGKKCWHTDDPEALRLACPFGAVGDRIWVRETFAVLSDKKANGAVYYSADSAAVYYNCSDHGEGDPTGLSGSVPAGMRYEADLVKRWTPSIHMPRWASRLTLEIVSVRLERLQAISQEDARAEGVSGGCLSCGEENCKCSNPRPDWRDAFAGLWMGVYGDESWINNPYVWVIEFKRVEGSK